MISRGNSIAFDLHLNKFVHLSCSAIKTLVARRTATVESHSGTVEALPSGLKPGSIVSYAKEWSRYLAYAVRNGFLTVPGLDESWCMTLLWHYLLFRSKTCRPSSIVSVLSALSHHGVTAGFLLPTSKFDSDSLGYKLIVRMRKQLALRHRARFGGLIAGYGPNRCTPLGSASVSLLFSACAVLDKESFQACSRVVRHNLWCSAMQHSRGMRYGHFIFRSYVISDFVVDGRDNTLRLSTDWHRYAGTSRYCLQFSSFPKWSCLYYDLRAQDGTVVDSVSAATISFWHFEQLRRDGEAQVFMPVLGGTFTRADRTAWLRSALLRAIPFNEDRARTMVAAVTGHSFRPGLAGDLLNDGAALTKIAFICRWQGTRVVRMYAERQPLFAFMSSANFNLIHH